MNAPVLKLKDEIALMTPNYEKRFHDAWGEPRGTEKSERILAYVRHEREIVYDIGFNTAIDEVLGYITYAKSMFTQAHGDNAWVALDTLGATIAAQRKSEDRYCHHTPCGACNNDESGHCVDHRGGVAEPAE